MITTVQDRTEKIRLSSADLDRLLDIGPLSLGSNVRAVA
jgi:hypothetical protein